MFVAKVLVGSYVKGDPKYRRPPHKQPLNGASILYYDSCVDDALKPTIFIVFDTDQFYPEYIIQYWTVCLHLKRFNSQRATTSNPKTCFSTSQFTMGSINFAETTLDCKNSDLQKSCLILYFFIVHENLCFMKIYSFRKAWVASTIYYVQLVMVMMYICTHKTVRLWEGFDNQIRNCRLLSKKLRKEKRCGFVNTLKVEKQAMSIIFPGLPYQEAIELVNIVPIVDFITGLCSYTFDTIIKCWFQINPWSGE